MTPEQACALAWESECPDTPHGRALIPRIYAMAFALSVEGVPVPSNVYRDAFRASWTYTGMVTDESYTVNVDLGAYGLGESLMGPGSRSEPTPQRIAAWFVKLVRRRRRKRRA